MADERRKALGQYFTPTSVIDFALDALQWLSAPQGLSPARRRVIDPSCGDGGFLCRALDKGYVTPANALGLDRDPELADAWTAMGWGGPEGPHVGIGDGLLSDAVGSQQVACDSFDWVVGNPPYAGEGLKAADDEQMAQICRRYELYRARHRDLAPGRPLPRTIPVEVLFVERFVRLCRPGGHIAVVLPEGLFANSRWGFVREWLLGQASPRAVVGLPRRAFGRAGITAKTCLAIACKVPATPDDEVFLAEAAYIGARRNEPNELPRLLELWQARGHEVTDPQPWRLR